MTGDFNIKVVADTARATQDLNAVDKAAQAVEKPRTVNIEFPNYATVSRDLKAVQGDIQGAANAIKQFYTVGSKIPYTFLNDIEEMRELTVSTSKASIDLGRQFGAAGKTITSAASVATNSVQQLAFGMAKLGFAIYGVQAAVGIMQTAFGGFFSATLGAEAQLRATILKTQTTLASTSKVFEGERQITDPYEKIVKLTGAVRDNVDSIRERSIALAGVTSNEVIEVFNIVASQISMIGGGLKDAEDLAIKFAAALGTFGMPLYQARQEIGSILRGDITINSYIAKSLGITNEDIARAKTQAGGVVAFLNDKLAAAVAGQGIAAQGLAGVWSNIRDIAELVTAAFGAGALDPLLDSISAVYDGLYAIKDELIDFAQLAGTVVGKVGKLVVGSVADTSSLTPQDSEGAKKFMASISGALTSALAKVSAAVSSIYGQLTGLVDRLTKALSYIVKGLADLAAGLFSLQVEKFKALISIARAFVPVLQGLSAALSGMLSVWGQWLQLPLVQQFTQILAGMRLLNATGIIGLIRGGLALRMVFTNWGKITEFVTTQITRLRAILGGLVVQLSTLASTALTTAGVMLAAWQPKNKALQAVKLQLQDIQAEYLKIAQAAGLAGNKITGANKDSSGGVTAGSRLLGFVFSMIKFQLILVAITAALSLLAERFGAFSEARDRAASTQRAELALERLRTTYKNLGDTASESEKRAAAFERSLVDAQYDQAVERLEKVRKKIEEIQLLTDPSRQGLGTALQRYFQSLNPSNFNVWIDRFKKPGALDFGEDRTGFAKDVLKSQEAESRKALDELAKWQRELDKDNLDEKIRLEKDNRTNLEKEIAEFQRGVDSALFQKRQEQAQREVDVFREAGELRIAQMERANALLIEGEEGASRAALEALNNYLSVRKRGELDIEVAKKNLAIEVANLERSVVDYRYEQEKRIADIRKKLGEYETKVAQFKTDQARLAAEITAGTASSSPGGEGGASSGVFFGRTGSHSVTDPNWAHGHFQSTSPQALIEDTLPILRKLVNDGVEVEMAGGVYPTKSMNDAALRGLLERARQLHTHSGSGSSLDINVKGLNIPIGVPVSGIVDTKGRGGVMGSLPGGRTQVGHLPQSALSASSPSSTTTDLGAIRRLRYGAQIIKAAEQEGVDPGLLAGLVMAESSGDHWIGQGRSRKINTSDSGALGLTQLKPGTAREVGVDPLDPQQNLIGGARYLKRQIAEFGTVNGLRAYNQGPGAQRLTPEGNKAEARAYPGKVLEAAARFGFHALSGGATAGAPSAPGGPAMAALPPPEAPAFESDGGSAEFERITRNLANLQARLTELRKQLTEARTAEAFDNIVKALFPPVAMEEIQNNILGLTTALDNLAALDISAVENLDDLRLKAELETEIAIVAREREETLAGIAKRREEGKITADQEAKLQKDITEKEVEHLTQLRERNKLKEQSLALSKKQQIIEGLITDTIALRNSTQTDLNQLQFDFLSSQFREDSPLRDARRRAEFTIAARRASEIRNGATPGDANFEASMAKFAEATRTSAEVLGAFAQQVFEYNKKLAQARDYAGSLTAAMKGFTGGVLSGGNLSEVMTNTVQALTDKVLGMALDYAFKPMELQLEALFKNYLGAVDPQITATDENTAAIKNLTTAIQTLTPSGPIAPGAGPLAPDAYGDANYASIYGATPGGAFTFPSAGSAPFLPGAPSDLIPNWGPGVPESNEFSAFFRAASGSATSLEAFQSTLPELTTSTTTFAANLTKAAEETSALPEGISQLQQTIGNVVGVMAGLGMTFAGIDTLSKGGTKNTLSGLAGIFTGVGSLFMGGFGGLIPRRARGGRTLPGRPYVVGDNPDGSLNATSELFVPDTAGNVFSAGQTASMLGGPGSAFERTRAALSQQLTSARSNAVQDEYERATGNGGSMKIETIQVGSLDVVTKQQFLEGMDQTRKAAAKEGEARVMRRAKSSTSFPGVR